MNTILSKIHLNRRCGGVGEGDLLSLCGSKVRGGRRGGRERAGAAVLRKV